jgi:ABC-type branched-subunit amino acid transport system substrate-binding protein
MPAHTENGRGEHAAKIFVDAARSAIVSGMQGEGRRLGIDFGTSSTVAVLTQADGRLAPVLFGETPVLPSAVCADAGGRLLAGRDALYLGRSRPEHLEPNPKRRIDEGAVLLGEREVPVAEVVAAVLRRVGEEAARVAGGPLAAPGPAGLGAAEAVLTCPAGWGPRRRAVLREAAELAGLGAVTLIAEPVAAASYFVHVLGNDIPAGHCLLVYDFGAGTFDASVVRRTGDGFTVLAEEGLTDAGGLDIDAAIVSYLGAVYAAQAPAAWARLTQPAGPAELRANRQLWQDVRDAKEMLSRTATTSIHLPLLEADAPLGREQFEHLARPVLDRTVAATRTALRVSGVGPGELAGVFLVGGSSRIPLAATLLHRALGIAPTAIEQPELVVAGGSLYAPQDAALAADPPPPPPPAPAPAPAGFPTPPPAAPTPPPAVAPPVAPPVAAPVSAGPAAPVSSMPVSPVAAPVSPAAGLFGDATSPPMTVPPTAPPSAPAQDPIRIDVGSITPPPQLSPPPPAPRRRAGRTIAVVAAAVAVFAVGVTAVALFPRDDGGPGSRNANGASGPCTNPKIGFLGAVTGSNSSMGQPMVQAVRLAVKQYQAKHASCPVELQEVDSQGQPEIAQTKVASLGSHVLGLVGPLFSSEIGATGLWLDDAGLPFITPSATNDELSTKGWRTFHRAVPPDGALGTAAAKYLAGQGRKSVYVVTPQDAYGQTLGDSIRNASGVSVVSSAEIVTGDTDFASLASTIAGSGAQSVFFGGYIDEGVAFVKALRQAGFSGPVVAGNSVFDRSFASGLGGNAGQLYVVCGCPPVTDNDFRSAYKSEYGTEPEAYAGTAYDSANMLLDAIAHGADSRTKVGEYLGSKTFEGVKDSKYRFTATGELTAENASVAVYSVTGGGFQFQKSV